MKYFAVFALIFCLLGTALAALKNPICGEEFGSFGPCRGRIQKFTYRRDANECISFYYTGCQGNKNNFNSKDECERTCKN
ncbi:kunitz-type serine protease inhibitor 2-like [Drosophila rhopaloa]|uniref:Kunitz-type serine protease inhibitor 2-like n=1 Tax=Drosophila rhopaloa TaxID=1041015 RepID=A0A6P4EXJ5_DRORH|nr:kunitz-type serine protease inhibitor 2-like [Drosophila rhopaloa]